MKRNIITFLLLSIAFTLSSQIAPNKYYVQFTDKNDSPYSLDQPEEYLSQRAIARRAAFNIPIDLKDIPVNKVYVLGVQNAGATILNTTKWLNGVTVQTSNPSVITAIEALPYVASVMKSGYTPQNGNIEKSFFMNESYGIEPSTTAQAKSTSFYDYGPSYNQIHMLKGDEMHEMGYRGDGVIIGVLDSGFENADELAVFDTLWTNNQIIATHDFVSGGPVTFDKHYHGSMVLSTMGGNIPGTLIGTAPEASYLLLRTEDAGTEYIIEEYNWVSGAEFADSVGADVLNTSLGYSTFDDPSQDHTYDDMDGNTTPISIGADIAASRGMIVVNSAGNEGSSPWYYITAPADGDSVIAVGAVNAAGFPASFSGHGPSSDNQVKPNVAAQGEGAFFANTDGGFIYGNGTSFSSPILAGMMACLRQANPDMSNMDLANAVEASGSLAPSYDYEIGYGIPDFMAAHNILTVIDNDGEIVITNLNVYPNPFISYFDMVFTSEKATGARLTVTDMTGRLVYESSHELKEGFNQIRTEVGANFPSGMYFLRLESKNTVVTSKLIRQ